MGIDIYARERLTNNSAIFSGLSERQYDGIAAFVKTISTSGTRNSGQEKYQVGRAFVIGRKNAGEFEFPDSVDFGVINTARIIVNKPGLKI